MKIGVSGASGQLGRAVLEELRRRAPASEIIAISRTPEGLMSASEMRHGDYDDAESLRTAYAALDRLLIIPSADLRPGVRSAQSVAAIKAAVVGKVGQIFLLSATGTRAKSEPALGAAYWAAEQQLVRSDAKAWTILRMNYFSETLLQEAEMAKATGMLPGFAENRVAYVSREDVAGACAGALLTNGHMGAIYNLCGPEAIGGAERASLLSKASGSHLSFEIVTEDQLRGGLSQAGVPPFIIDALVSMQLSFVDGAYNIITGDIEKLSGTSPRPLQAVLAGSFA